MWNRPSSAPFAALLCAALLGLAHAARADGPPAGPPSGMLGGVPGGASAGPPSLAPGGIPGGVPGGGADAQAENPVIARVNGIELHRSDLDVLRRGLPPQLRSEPIDKVYPIVLRRLIDGKLLIEAARQAKLEQDPELQRRLAQFEDRLLQQAYIDRLVAEAVTDEKLRARYQTEIAGKGGREEVRARQILVPSEAEARSIIAELDKGADFVELAKKYSKDPSAENGGELGYFTHDKMVPAFADAAFALPAGGYTKEPVKTAFGWHVIEVEDRRMGPPPSFEESREQLLKLVVNETVEERLRELRSAARIETFGPDGKPVAEPGSQSGGPPVGPPSGAPGK